MSDLIKFDPSILDIAGVSGQENREKVDSARISFKGGKFTLQDSLLGNAGLEFWGIVLNFSFLKTFYTRKYKEGEALLPDCFAVSLDADQKLWAPHANAYAPQAMNCDACEHNKWGTADDGDGKGKACRDQRRLVVLAADSFKSGALGLEDATLGVMELPPTSIKNWKKYYNDMRVAYGVDSFAYVTKFTLDENVDYPVVKYSLHKFVDSREMLLALKAKVTKEALEMALRPYPKEDEPRPETKASKPRNRKY